MGNTPEPEPRRSKRNLATAEGPQSEDPQAKKRQKRKKGSQKKDKQKTAGAPTTGLTSPSGQVSPPEQGSPPTGQARAPNNAGQRRAQQPVNPSSAARPPLSSGNRGSNQELTEGTPRGNQSTGDQANLDASDERDAQIQALREADVDLMLQAQVAALEAAANAARDKENRPTTNNRPIELKKPDGEAGGGKKGFNLQRAMGLEDEDEIYKRIQADVRFNIWKYGLDPWKKYMRQSPEKISHVLQAGRQQHKYLCTERFPDDWAQTEMIKTITRNRRKYLRRKARAAGKDVADSSDSEEEDEEDNLPDLDAPQDGQ